MKNLGIIPSNYLLYALTFQGRFEILLLFYGLKSTKNLNN